MMNTRAPDGANNAISSNKYKPDTTTYTVVAKMDYILDGIFGFKLKID